MRIYTANELTITIMTMTSGVDCIRR